MKTKTYTITLILITIATIMITTFIYTDSKIYHSQSFPMQINVSNYTGIVTEPELNFGTNKPGNAVTKPFIITNSDTDEHLVKLIPNTNFNKWITISNNSFILKPNETIKVNIMITVPEGTAYDSYKGNLNVIFHK